jgi:hypothetical protein
MLRARLIWTVFAVCLSTLLLGQGVDIVYVYGTVKDYTSSKKLDGVTVSVFKNGAKLAETTTNASGKYEFNLDYGSDYKIVYGKTGVVAKNITIDTRNIPEEERVGGHGMNVEMTLFNELPGMDFSVLQQPIGKAKFDAATSEVTWDLQYTEQIRSEIARLMNEYDSKKKREANAEEDFKKAMANGESAMAAADYKKAVESFNAALVLKPAEPKATARLSDAKMKLDELEGDKKKNEEYAALIKEADGLYGKKDYEGAKGKYLAASGVKQEEPYPKGKIKECEAFLAELEKKAEEEKKAKELEEKYKASITAADASFKGAKYEEARTKYTEAAALKPAEQYPKDQLAAITKKLEELANKAEEEKKAKEIEARYQAAIVAADAAFKAKNWEQAKTKYNEALGIKAEEKYPQDQLSAIDKTLSEKAEQEEADRLAKELEANYKAALDKGDAAFRDKKWEEAKAGYNEALALKAAEKYPKDQLVAIDKTIADADKQADAERKKKELDEAYAAALAKGDAAFRDTNWDEAKAGYNEAIALTAAEKYPKDQLVAIDKAIADAKRTEDEEKARQEQEARYQKLIENANELFQNANYTAAKGKYQEASAVKPDERSPKDKMAECDVKIAEMALLEEEERKRRELDDKYNELIAQADKNFDGEKLAEALKDYKDALQLKPAEQHPADRIANIEQRLDSDARAKAEKERLEREQAELEKRYNDLVTKADAAFSSKQYENAKLGYQDALTVKEGEKHPTDRLAEIDRIMAEMAANDEAARLKAEAEAAEKARLEEELRRKQADIDALENSYRDQVAAGDLAFGQDSYDVAREKYTAALAIKPEETYPKDQLTRMETELALRLKAMDDAAREAEEARRLEEERRRKEAEDAEAARLAADEERRRMEGEKEREARYRQVIADGDGAFGETRYTDARDLYTQALDMKPDDTYPRSKIEQIDKLLAEIERKRLEAEMLAQKQEEPPPPPKRANSTVDVSKEQEAIEFMREARAREEAEKYERIKKQKADVNEQEVEHGNAAADRRGGGVQQKRTYEEGAGLYAGRDGMRQANLDAVNAEKERLAEQERQRRERFDVTRGQAYDGKLDAEVAIAERNTTWNDRHERSVEGAQQEAVAFRDKMAEVAQAGNDRTAQAKANNEALATDQARMKERGDRLQQEQSDLVASDKQRLAAQESQLINRAQDQRMASKEQLDRTALNQPKSFADHNRSKLATEYPEGVTEESYTEGNKVIIRRVVVNGNKADDYSKVIAKWGTFYFRNGQSITEMIWVRDTEQ